MMLEVHLSVFFIWFYLGYKNPRQQTRALNKKVCSNSKIFKNTLFSIKIKTVHTRKQKVQKTQRNYYILQLYHSF